VNNRVGFSFQPHLPNRTEVRRQTSLEELETIYPDGDDLTCERQVPL
jgi:hypothetical protein